MTATTPSARSNPRVIGLGEVLWDDLPDGRRLGGAPANVAYHAGLRGADAHVISAVGKDEPGNTALQRLQSKHVGTDGIAVLDEYPTGVVDVTLDNSGSASYDIRQGVAWDHIPASDTALKLIATADAICFGTLAQRHEAARLAIHTLLDAARPDCLRVYDVNLRPPHFTVEIIRGSVERCDVLKLNSDEIADAAKALSCPSKEADFAKFLLDSGLRMVVVTRGGDGSALYTADDMSEFDPEPVEVVDTVGAGDSFTAAVLMGILNGEPLPDIHRKAAAVASYVCTQNGATPEVPGEVLRGE